MIRMKQDGFAGMLLCIVVLVLGLVLILGRKTRGEASHALAAREREKGLFLRFLSFVVYIRMTAVQISVLYLLEFACFTCY